MDITLFSQFEYIDYQPIDLIMATNKWYVILLQLILFGFNKINSQTLSTVPCQPVLQYYFNYLTESHPSTVRYLSIQATFILENRYVAGLEMGRPAR